MTHMTQVVLGAILWLGWVISWNVAALWHARRAVEADRRGYRGHLALVFAGFVLLFVQGQGRLLWNRPLWLLPSWGGWVCLAAELAGFLFAWWARIQLGRLWSGGVELREGHRIVDSGPYGLVRHPIYSGLIAGAAAFAILSGRPLAILGACLYGLGFTLKARYEERFLAQQFPGPTYQAYRARVPLIVPWRKR